MKTIITTIVIAASVLFTSNTYAEDPLNPKEDLPPVVLTGLSEDGSAPEDMDIVRKYIEDSIQDVSARFEELKAKAEAYCKENGITEEEFVNAIKEYKAIVWKYAHHVYRTCQSYRDGWFGKKRTENKQLLQTLEQNGDAFLFEMYRDANQMWKDVEDNKFNKNSVAQYTANFEKHIEKSKEAPEPVAEKETPTPQCQGVLYIYGSSVGGIAIPIY